MSDPSFTVGPPQAVTDSRLLPAVTATDEAGFVHGADLDGHPDAHPDNRPLQAGELDVVGFGVDPPGAVDEPVPTEVDLDAVVAGIDVDAVDEVGFDDTDTGTEPDDLDTGGPA